MPEEKTTTNPRSVAQLSGRVTQETLAKFKEIQEAESFETFGQFVESLLMHYYDPVKVNKENEAVIKELRSKIKELELENKGLNDAIDDRDSRFDSDMQKQGVAYAELQKSFDELQQQFNEQGAKLDEYRGLEHKMDGHILVPVNELDMRCLEWLAAREAKARKREDITPAVFFQYAVREMLIKGNKFAIDTVPDRVIDQFKKEISNGQ